MRRLTSPLLRGDRAHLSGPSRFRIDGEGGLLSREFFTGGKATVIAAGCETGAGIRTAYGASAAAPAFHPFDRGSP